MTNERIALYAIIFIGIAISMDLGDYMREMSGLAARNMSEFTNPEYVRAVRDILLMLIGCLVTVAGGKTK